MLVISEIDDSFPLSFKLPAFKNLMPFSALRITTFSSGIIWWIFQIQCIPNENLLENSSSYFIFNVYNQTQDYGNGPLLMLLFPL